MQRIANSVYSYETYILWILKTIITDPCFCSGVPSASSTFNWTGSKDINPTVRPEAKPAKITSIADTIQYHIPRPDVGGILWSLWSLWSKGRDGGDSEVRNLWVLLWTEFGGRKEAMDPNQLKKPSPFGKRLSLKSIALLPYFDWDGSAVPIEVGPLVIKSDPWSESRLDANGTIKNKKMKIRIRRLNTDEAKTTRTGSPINW